MSYINKPITGFLRTMLSKQKGEARFTQRKLYLASPKLAVTLAQGWIMQYNLPVIFLLVIRKRSGFACIFQAGPALSNQPRMSITRSEAINILKGGDYQYETFCITSGNEYVNLDLDINIEHLVRDLYG